MMKSLREGIEIGFEQFTIWVFAHPWKVIAGVILFMAFRRMMKGL